VGQLWNTDGDGLPVHRLTGPPEVFFVHPGLQLRPEKSGGGGKRFRAVGTVVVHGQVWIRFGMIKMKLLSEPGFPRVPLSVLFRRTMKDL